MKKIFLVKLTKLWFKNKCNPVQVINILVDDKKTKEDCIQESLHFYNIEKAHLFDSFYI